MGNGIPLRGIGVCITGGASGIGRALARTLFVDQGCNVLLVDRDEAGLTRLRNELNPSDGASRPLGSGRFETLALDLTALESPEAVAARLKEFPVQVLVHCAGVTQIGVFESAPIQAFEAVMNINILALARLTHAVLPHLLAQSDTCIVNIASLAGLVGAPGMAAYSASKFAVVGFSEALALELQGRVHVATVCPGLVNTSILAHQVDPGLGSTGLESLLSRAGVAPEKVARAVVRSIRKRERFALVTPDSQITFGMRRLFPKLTHALVLRAFRQLQKGGLIR